MLTSLSVNGTQVRAVTMLIVGFGDVRRRAYIEFDIQDVTGNIPSGGNALESWAHLHPGTLNEVDQRQIARSERSPPLSQIAHHASSPAES